MANSEVEAFLKRTEIRWSRWDDNPPIELWGKQLDLKAGELVRFGVPSKGPMLAGSEELLIDCGARIRRKPRQLVVDLPLVDGNTVDIVRVAYLRPRIIFERVATGDLDLGIVGADTIAESITYNYVNKVLDLGFGACKLALSTSPSNLRSTSRVATTRPNIVTDYLKKQGIIAQVIPEEGTTEGMVRMGWADAVCDIFESGQSFEDNGLSPWETVMQIQAELISNPNQIDSQGRLSFVVGRLIQRIEAVTSSRTNAKKQDESSLAGRLYSSFWNISGEGNI